MRKLAAAAFLVAVTGCIKLKDETVVMPDGSGRKTLVISLNELLIKAVADDGEKPEGRESFGLEELEKMEGFVAFTRSKEETKDGWKTVTITGYFDDLSKVRIHDDRGGENKVVVSYSFKKVGDGFELTVDDAMFSGDRADASMPEDQKKMAWGIMKTMIQGLEVGQRVTMPGSVTSSEGFPQKEGRAAWNSWSGAALKSYDDYAKMQAASKRKIACGKSEIAAAELEAFRKELEEAKAAWLGIREELRKEAEKRRKGGK